MKLGILHPAFLLIAAAALFSGCSTINSRINANSSAFAAATADQQKLIREGHIAIGFTKEMVLMAFGEPDRVYVHMDAAKGASERWVYYIDDVRTAFVYDSFWGPAYSYRHRYPRGWGFYGGYYPVDVYSHHQDASVRFENDKVVAFEESRR